jgi:type IV secretion system protein VirD4
MNIPPLIVVEESGFTVYADSSSADSLLETEAFSRSNSFVIHDPTGSIQERYEAKLYEKGYNIKTLNTSRIQSSSKYNPFEYIRGLNTIQKMASALIRGTCGISNRSDTNFILLETMLLETLIGFMHEHAQPKEMNIETLVLMLEYMEQDEQDKEAGRITAVDMLFKQYEELDPELIPLHTFKHFKASAGKDEQQIIASCVSRLTPLNTKRMRKFMSKDELILSILAFVRTALFVRNGNTGKNFSFIAPLMYSQLLDILCSTHIRVTA